jgi:DNA-binding response OmpR family regulator
MSNELVGPAVLVVDDEPLVQVMLYQALQDAGFEVILASDYEEAIASLHERAGALTGLLTDINLGASQSGWDIAVIARELMPTLPVVYVTGDSAHEWPSRGVPHSVLISKPFAAAQVVVALAGLANRADEAGASEGA